MKKITCIQQYVLDNLIEDEILSTTCRDFSEDKREKGWKLYNRKL